MRVQQYVLFAAKLARSQLYTGTFASNVHVRVSVLRMEFTTTFTENYGKLRARGMGARDEPKPFPISLGSATLFLFTTR